MTWNDYKLISCLKECFNDAFGNVYAGIHNKISLKGYCKEKLRAKKLYFAYKLKY